MSSTEQPIRRFARYGADQLDDVLKALRPAGRWQAVLSAPGPLHEVLLKHGRIVPGSVILWGSKAPVSSWPQIVDIAQQQRRREPTRVEAFVIAGDVVAYQANGAIMVHPNDPIMRSHLQRSLSLLNQIVQHDELRTG